MANYFKQRRGGYHPPVSRREQATRPTTKLFCIDKVDGNMRTTSPLRNKNYTKKAPRFWGAFLVVLNIIWGYVVRFFANKIYFSRTRGVFF